MRVGQVTFCGYNYGSVLQCYATQQELEKHNAECILLVRSEAGIGRVLQSLEFRSNILYKMIRFPQYNHFFRDSLYQLRKSDIKSEVSEESKQAINAFIQARICRSSYSWKQLCSHEKFDFFISGSDQIWSAHWFITNRMWFLRFCPKEKRVAWMPSFGGERLEKYNRTTYKKYISDYTFLSVREESGRRIIADLINKEVPVLADPVFLLSASEWRKVAAEQTSLFSHPYIMMFFLDKPSTLAIKQAEMLKKDTGAEILYFAYHYADEGNVLVNGGPERFLQMIDNATVVLTDSFHACAFSAIMHTPFYAFQRNSASGAAQMVRVINLLNEFSLEKRYITTENECAMNIEELPEMLIDTVLYQMKGRIQKYLEDILRWYEKKGEKNADRFLF